MACSTCRTSSPAASMSPTAIAQRLGARAAQYGGLALRHAVVQIETTIFSPATPPTTATSRGEPLQRVGGHQQLQRQHGDGHRRLRRPPPRRPSSTVSTPRSPPRGTRDEHQHRRPRPAIRHQLRVRLRARDEPEQLGPVLPHDPAAATATGSGLITASRTT